MPKNPVKVNPKTLNPEFAEWRKQQILLEKQLQDAAKTKL
eukprot:CAMPEP_0169476456 /NCGR_PEP_ID=MMETSP1042-20121227/27375_1 /TAXON_ID=464988 /ORGANISM="Hemiselmis andersenii, Strain CCMP1180" /LENGTH=39 /DNA_ID= /DNA_START= /DNA_END= /DNA_ORIENTATION=